MVNEELKKLLVDVEVEEDSLRRIENQVFAHIGKRNKRPISTYIGVAVAATLCATIISYQIPSVKAWVKETFSYIPGFNEKVEKSSGVLYNTTGEYKKGKFTVHKAAYEATSPYFNLEFTYDTGVRVDPNERDVWKTLNPIAHELEKRKANIIVGKEIFPLTYNGSGFGTDGLWLGTYSLDKSVQQLPFLTKGEVTLQFGEERIVIPLKVNEDIYTPIKSKVVHGYELQGMIMEKGKNVYVNFIDEKKEWTPFIYDGFPGWIEDKNGKKYNLQPNESSPLVHENYKTKWNGKSEIKKVVVPHLQQIITLKDEYMTVPIPKKVGEVIPLQPYQVKGTNISLEDAKVVRTETDNIEIQLPNRESVKEDWLLTINLSDEKRKREIISSQQSSEDNRKRTMFTPTQYTISVLPTDKNTIVLKVDSAELVRYGPWEMEVKE